MSTLNRLSTPLWQKRRVAFASVVSRSIEMTFVLRGRQFAAPVLLAASILLQPYAAQASNAYRLLQIDGRDVKWGPPSFGVGATLTYAIVDGQNNFSGANNCRRISSVGLIVAHSHMSRKTFDSEVSNAFAMWEEAANLRFRLAKSAQAADILISSETEPDGIAFADVKLAPSSGRNFSRIVKGVVCLNPQVEWTSDSSLRIAPSNRSPAIGAYHLKYVLTHEIGHLLGLDHPGPAGELMSFEYRANFDALQTGDVAGIIALYGARTTDPILALNEKSAQSR